MEQLEGLSKWDLADIRDEEQDAGNYYKRLLDEEDALIEYVEKNGKWRA